MATPPKPPISDSVCRHCGRQTLGGWSGSGQVASIQVTVDAAPLTPLQELAATLAGWRTWTFHTGVRQLHTRDAGTIRRRPAGTRPRQTVHAQHQCTPHPWRTWA